MSAEEVFGAFDEQLDFLERSLGGAQSLTAEFAKELDRVKAGFTETTREAKGLSSGLSRDLKHALSGALLDGRSVTEAVGTVGRSVVDRALNAAVTPVTKGVGDMIASGMAGVFGGGRFAHGAGFASGRVMPFARGGVVTGPTTFPTRGGTGLMGEAGPEAIMPLSRGSDGKLGVRTHGAAGRAVNVTMHVSTPDVQGFRRSQSQIASQMSRLLSRGERNG